MRILYAAGNRQGSFFQLKRFLDTIRHKGIEYKISAYKKSLGNLSVDYTLDSLLNFVNSEQGFSYNGNYTYYYNEIKRFKPDLIISDLDPYTSIIALELGIVLWQVSPLLLYQALPYEVKYSAKINSNYSFLFSSNHRRKKSLSYIVNNSDRKFVVSHLCDAGKNIQLNPGFEWVRPEFVLSDENTEELEFVVALPSGSANIAHSLRETNSIMFTNHNYDRYDKLLIENIYNEKEYKKQIGRGKVFISDGSAALSSDAFYNQKTSLFDVQPFDMESIIVSHLDEYFGLGKIIPHDMNADNLAPAQIVINDKVKFLHEELEAR